MSCFLKCCFSSSLLSSPASSCRSILLFIAPLVSPFCYQPPDFWPALPQEGAFGKQEGSCHASERPSGSLPVSHWIQLKLTLNRAPQTQVACALTWDEPLNRSQPHSFLRLWQGTETSCFLSRFQTASLALHGEGWTRSSFFLRAELARFALCPPHWGGGGAGRGGQGSTRRGWGSSTALGEGG